MPEDIALYDGIDASQFRGHPVSLENFSGPLDLLLYLVQKDKVEIWDISISRITEQYLDYLKSLEALNVEIAGEFLVMAATLLRIKSQMLLPRPDLPEDETELMPLTREQLIERLLEFRRYKEAAATLRRFEEQRLRCRPRGWVPTLPKDHLYPLREASVYDLASYLRDVMTREDSGPPTHEVQLEEIRIEERIELLLEKLDQSDKPQRFVDLLERPWWRLDWIVTFLAMLELVREGKVIPLQEEPFADLWLVGVKDSATDAAVEEMIAASVEEPA